ncbi:MAG: hypothetical protein GWN76_24415 [candidate division Zixibacteria bacterium]|nr:hypothetical protein [candidate division Zixibacteria bacterium]NIU17064.1 hypothetical protein [candidate division Zixibacteria bacterium]NIW97065.1 hypothetical protein [Phycisphaerae bacterium]
MIADEREVRFPEEDVGYLSKVDRSYIPSVLASINFGDIEASFEQLPYILEAGVKAVGTGVTCGNSGYKYVYAFPTTAANTLKTFTIEAGDDIQAQEMEYSFVTDFTLSGSGGDGWMVNSNWQGRQATDTTFTGALTLPTVEDMIFSKSKLYIDAVGGTIGGTQVTDTLLDATLNVNTGWIPKYTAEGELYFSFIQSTAPEITLDVTFEFNASAVTERGNWESEVARQVRLECLGAALTGTLTTTTYSFNNKAMIIDLAGKWEKFEAIGDRDGNDIISATLRARYNATAALFAEIAICNEVTTLP